MNAAEISATPTTLTSTLKEWAVVVRALREGRQILLLRKGGIREEGGEFEVQARNVLLFPTYLHMEEQRNALQPCYESWLHEESRRRPTGDFERIHAWAHITEIHVVTQFDGLFRLASQHIFSDTFLRYRVENEPTKPLYALFLRVYALERPAEIPLEPDYYGCKSWITLNEPVSLAGSRPALSDHTYEERVRVIRRILTEPKPASER
ncbi:MAG: DUF1802 family protein [Capsulimonadales bacterium]|nr:DUF1802 family protein [Capsulimonadales bacterium]